MTKAYRAHLLPLRGELEGVLMLKTETAELALHTQVAALLSVTRGAFDRHPMLLIEIAGPVLHVQGVALVFGSCFRNSSRRMESIREAGSPFGNSCCLGSTYGEREEVAAQTRFFAAISRGRGWCASRDGFKSGGKGTGDRGGQAGDGGKKACDGGYANPGLRGGGNGKSPKGGEGGML